MDSLGKARRGNLEKRDHPQLQEVGIDDKTNMQSPSRTAPNPRLDSFVSSKLDTACM